MERLKVYIPEIISILGIIYIAITGDMIARQAILICTLITIILATMLYLMKKFE